MLFNKKGDLAISTNAIVVLIIAVIMLGLIIAFVTNGFGAVSDKFFGEIESTTPIPPTPSAAKPITASEVTIGRAGKEIGMKINIFNPTATDSPSDTAPLISCANPILETTSTSTQVNTRSVPASGWVTYTYVQKIADGAPAGKHLCAIDVPQLPTIGVADIIIEVRE